ncbi:hypothetical protein [Natranaerofaba carboxydovora]|uniref:hypothetical protein n=1 Tax=Natranaerofaba carboxydovora TaxID=2742683 RepID=UPI001F12DD38|nr:hypothetical protein [Natranaerofaba carboxydovora]UMZ73552.1 hypothetical protein ACONDI_01106 [Natranaerofaba carboxydovora]
MPIALLFRRKKEYSPFRNELLNLIKDSRGDKLLLGYGYIDDRNDKYSIINPICSHIEENENLKKVYVIAGNFEHNKHTTNDEECNGDNNKMTGNKCWNCALEKVRNKINERLENKGLDVKIINFNEEIDNSFDMSKWHAKVAMKFENDEPIAAIIGSSNLTNPAFNPHTDRRFCQFEVDVVIYLPGFDGIFDLNIYDQTEILFSNKLEKPGKKDSYNDEAQHEKVFLYSLVEEYKKLNILNDFFDK